MKISAKAGVPLMELLIAIGIFAYTGILIVRLFFTASYMERFAMDSNSAIMKAQSTFETLKASPKYDEDIYSKLGFTKDKNGDIFEQKFDENWNTTDNNSVFVMNLSVSKENSDGGTMVSQHITVRRCKSYPFLRDARDTLTDISCKQYYPNPK